MRDLIRLGVFGGFVGLGVLVALASWRSGSPWSRRASNVFLTYTLIVSFGAGILQRDFWPFSTWPLVAALHPEYSDLPRLVIVDREEREHHVDYRAWEPLIIEELLAWAGRGLLTLPREQQERAAEHLLGLVEQSMARVAAGGRPGVLRNRLGSLAAPSFLLHPAIWNQPSDLPSSVAGLRLYRERWNLDERLHDPAAVRRTLVFEYLRR